MLFENNSRWRSLRWRVLIREPRPRGHCAGVIRSCRYMSLIWLVNWSKRCWNDLDESLDNIGIVLPFAYAPMWCAKTSIWRSLSQRYAMFWNSSCKIIPTALAECFQQFVHQIDLKERMTTCRDDPRAHQWHCAGCTLRPSPFPFGWTPSGSINDVFSSAAVRIDQKHRPPTFVYSSRLQRRKQQRRNLYFVDVFHRSIAVRLLLIRRLMYERGGADSSRIASKVALNERFRFGGSTDRTIFSDFFPIEASKSSPIVSDESNQRLQWWHRLTRWRGTSS